MPYVDPTAPRSRRVKQRVWWAVTLPFAPLLGQMRRLMLYAGNKAYEGYLMPGERMLAVDAEVGADGHIWLASNEAVYVVPTASKVNRQLGRDHEVNRIPYANILSVEGFDTGGVRERVLLFQEGSSGETKTVVGWCDFPGGNAVTDMIRQKIGSGA